jgi:DNA-binding transcriptional ArsR family regulator
MEMMNALAAFQALGQPSRLAVFRLLVQSGPAGLPAGEIARQLDLRANTLSSQLAILQAAGLIRPSRDGRSIIYSADMAALRGLLTWLLQDCCGGAPELCAPVLDQIACLKTPCC